MKSLISPVYVLFMVCSLILSANQAGAAPDTVKFSFNNEEITKVVDTYAKASGQKFVLDPAVRGKITVLNADAVSVEEAFNLLSTTLALNGFAVSKQGDTFSVMSARNIQRNLIDVSTTLPSLKPERMATLIYTFKNVSAQRLFSDLRIISSKDGESSLNSTGNQVLMTDWTSNLHRVHQILQELDKPTDPQIRKMVESTTKPEAKVTSKKEGKPQFAPNEN